MKTPAHRHHFARHPNPDWHTDAACTACGFAVPVTLLPAALAAGATVAGHTCDARCDGSGHHTAWTLEAPTRPHLFNGRCRVEGACAEFAGAFGARRGRA
jgi:hypothetical protein